MKTPTALVVAASILALTAAASASDPVNLFDGKTFDGWQGETNRIWRIEQGAVVGGFLNAEVPRNEFLCTIRPYTNFVLRLKFRLLGTEGFVNAGVQIRSQRAKKPANEMEGYQADIGEGWFGALYDESRRNKVLIAPAAEAVKRAVKPGEWNDYRIQCEDRQIRTWINEVPMVDYKEPDLNIPQHGLIGLQIHGGGKAEIWYKDLYLTELP